MKNEGKRSPFLWALLSAAIVLLAAGAAALCIFWKAGKTPSVPEDPAPAPTVPTESTLSPTVRVTVPEGYTVERIAALLEAEDVCSAEDFRRAVQEGDFSDYAFVAEIPLTDESGADNGRIYRLEGYLFPDTYEFYRQCSGEAAVRRFLDNFSRKFDTCAEALSACGLTTDEAVTLASIIQYEIGEPTEMKRVSRVLWNRLESPDYPRLQCDTTFRYLKQLTDAGVTVSDRSDAAYDTYICRGLPVGAIGNPGLDALTAAVSPSEEEVCAGCYFFLTDREGAVHYSRTYAEHLAACQKYLTDE